LLPVRWLRSGNGAKNVLVLSGNEAINRVKLGRAPPTIAVGLNGVIPNRLNRVGVGTQNHSGGRQRNETEGDVKPGVLPTEHADPQAILAAMRNDGAKADGVSRVNGRWREVVHVPAGVRATRQLDCDI
jgi:hypothetical protein